jgi:hypothetical protein
MRRAMAARPANAMTKIPLNIDATPLVKSIKRSKQKTMTKATICVIEGALVGLAAVITWGMLVTLFSL